MEFLGHVWSTKEILIVIAVPCIFVALHYASNWLSTKDAERAEKNGR